MKTTLLAALLFQLLIQVKDNTADPAVPYEYGDIIAFQRYIFAYKHFGIYIGKRQRFEAFGQKEGEDLFHFSKVKTDGKWTLNCTFGKLQDEKKERKFNYLDGHAERLGLKVATESETTERIQFKLTNCPKYNALAENCEHLATYVRYKVSIALQLGTVCKGRCDNTQHGWTDKEVKEVLTMLKEGFDGTYSEYEKENKEICESLNVAG